MSQASQRISWRELFLRALELGMGAVVLTKETAARLVHDLRERGSAARAGGRQLVDQMMEKGGQQRERLAELMAQAVEKVLAKADLARRSDLEALEGRVGRLEEAIGQKGEG